MSPRRDLGGIRTQGKRVSFHFAMQNILLCKYFVFRDNNHRQKIINFAKKKQFVSMDSMKATITEKSKIFFNVDRILTRD